MKYKMKFFGSALGKVSGLTRHFDKGQVIEALQGEFDESTAEEVSEVEKKEVKIAEKPVETASVKPGNKRGK